MKIGMHQPYFFPYIGFFQLINMVDRYALYDDGLFADNKWAYRNRILLNGAPYLFRINILKASSNKRFNEIKLSNDMGENKKKIRTLQNTYRKAPYYSDVMPLLEQFLTTPYDNLAECNVESIKMACKYLGIKTEILLFSDLDYNRDLKKQYKIFDLCKLLGCNEYINAIGGTELYDFEEFRENGIELSFLKSDDIVYPQFGKEFVPNLSIIDVMMFNSVPKIQEMLTQYTLIKS